MSGDWEVRSDDRARRFRVVEALELSHEWLEEEGVVVASIPWDSGGMASGCLTVWAFRDFFVMWDDWSGAGRVSAEVNLLDALADLNLLELTGAEESYWADVDTEELIDRMRPNDSGEGVFITTVNGVEVEVDVTADTVRRVS